jgi:hypothetical protein
MFTVPASYASVPFTVVNRTKFKVPDRDTDPPETSELDELDTPPVKAATHVFDEALTRVNVIIPCITFVAEPA